MVNVRRSTTAATSRQPASQTSSNPVNVTLNMLLPLDGAAFQFVTSGKDERFRYNHRRRRHRRSEPRRRTGRKAPDLDHRGGGAVRLPFHGPLSRILAGAL